MQHPILASARVGRDSGFARQPVAVPAAFLPGAPRARTLRTPGTADSPPVTSARSGWLGSERRPDPLPSPSDSGSLTRDGQDRVDSVLALRHRAPAEPPWRTCSSGGKAGPRGIPGPSTDRRALGALPSRVPAHRPSPSPELCGCPWTSFLEERLEQSAGDCLGTWALCLQSFPEWTQHLCGRKLTPKALSAFHR